MKANHNDPTKPAPPAPTRLRNDQTFLQLYTGILSSLYTRYDYDLGDIEEKELHGRARSLAQLAHLGACHAHLQLQLSEPYKDEEVAAFNEAINHNNGNPNTNTDDL